MKFDANYDTECYMLGYGLQYVFLLFYYHWQHGDVTLKVTLPR